MIGRALDRINAAREIATKTEKKIIDGILEIPAEEIIYMSISDLAAKLNVADATLVRFCKEMLYTYRLLPNGECEEQQMASLYANNGVAERMAFRGERWGQGRNAGVLKLCFDDPRSYTGEAVGFRSVYHP